MFQAESGEEFQRREEIFLNWYRKKKYEKAEKYYCEEWQSYKKLWSLAYREKGTTGWKVVATNNLVEHFFRVSVD